MKTACGLWLSGTIPRTWNDPLSLPVMLKWWPSTCSETIDMPLRSLLDCSLLFYWWSGTSCCCYPPSLQQCWLIPPLSHHGPCWFDSAFCQHRAAPMLTQRWEFSLSYTGSILQFFYLTLKMVSISYSPFSSKEWGQFPWDWDIWEIPLLAKVVEINSDTNSRELLSDMCVCVINTNFSWLTFHNFHHFILTTDI